MGVNQRETKNQKPMVRAVTPVRPPARMPVADSAAAAASEGLVKDLQKNPAGPHDPPELAPYMPPTGCAPHTRAARNMASSRQP